MIQLDTRVGIDMRSMQIMMIPQHGPPVNLLHDTRRVVNDFLETAIRVVILQKFAKVQASDAPRRKDMIGIPPLVN